MSRGILFPIMQIKNPELFTSISAISEHFKNNISNRFTERALADMQLDNGTWTLIRELTERYENYRIQGYHFDEIYMQILALAKFIKSARTEVLPNIRFLNSPSRSGHPQFNDNRIIRDMAIQNFGPNLQILADRLNELYFKVVAIDKLAAGDKRPFYATLPELGKIGQYLVE